MCRNLNLGIINGLATMNRTGKHAMARNPYIKQHADFAAWLERERATMAPEVIIAAEYFRTALYGASKNPDPPSGFVDAAEKWAGEYREHVQRHAE